MSLRRFVAAFLVVVLALALTLKMKVFIGWSPSLVLSALAAFGMMLSFNETFLLAGLSGWVFMWQPAPGPETIILIAIPLAIAASRKLLPWQSWLSLVFILGGGIGLLYSLLPEALSRYGAWIALDIAGSLVLALGIRWLFQYSFGRSAS